MRADPAVRVEGLTAGYRSLGRRREVLAGVTLALPRGSVTGVVGLNGVGKTTLLRVLMGFLPAWEGTVLLEGHAPGRYRVGAGVGYLPESVGLPAALDVATLLRLAARLSGLRRGERPEAVGRALEEVGLARHALTPLGRLSRGQARRVALAWALTGEPWILLLDEPEGGLDPRSRVTVREAIRRAARRGVTVIVCSHDLAELQRSADRVVVLDEGRVVRLLGPAETRGADLESLLLGEDAP